MTDRTIREVSPNSPGGEARTVCGDARIEKGGSSKVFRASQEEER